MATGDPALGGVAVFARTDAAERAGTDRVRVDLPTGRLAHLRPVAALLCGEKACG